MRALMIGLLTVAGIAIATPISLSPAAAQGVTIETPAAGVRVGPQRHYDRDRDTTTTVPAIASRRIQRTVI